MVEMVETAAILNQASERSFVVLDEIGRGTATFDGLSIAWATLEYLHEVNRCRVLFATHYHELTALADTSAARRQRHGRGQGVARRDRVPLSRGARAPPTAPTASMWRSSPACRRPVLARANEVLTELEKADGRPKPSDLAADLPLVQRRQRVATQPQAQRPSPLEAGASAPSGRTP